MKIEMAAESAASLDAGVGVAQSALDSALLDALGLGDVRAARAALDAGANPRARKKHAWAFRVAEGADLSALEWALFTRQRASAELILNEQERLAAPLSSEDRRSTLELFEPRVWVMGVFCRRDACLATLIKALRPGDIEHCSGASLAVSWSCHYDYEALLEMLLAAGASPSKQGPGRELGPPPLLWAARSGNERLIELLINAGADPNERDVDGDTPLCRVAWEGDPWGVEKLLKWSDPRCLSVGGRTALHQAARRGRVDCLRELAPVSDALAKTDEGKTALDFARAWGCAESIGILEQAELDALIKSSGGLTRKSSL